MRSFLTAFIFFIFASCQNHGNSGQEIRDSAKEDGVIVTDTATLPTDTTEKEASSAAAPQGIFQGRLPCSDCPFIEHTVAFYPDGHYRQEEAKYHKTNTVTQSTGKWKLANNILTLYKEQQPAGTYTWRNNELFYVIGEKEHLLHSMPSAGSNKIWSKKKEQGIEFFGVGNEPFWNIEIDEQKYIAFHLAEWKSPLRFQPAKGVERGDSTTYYTRNDSVQLLVTVYNRFCNDGMSDYLYHNKVVVQFNGQAYHGCGINYQEMK